MDESQTREKINIWRIAISYELLLVLNYPTKERFKRKKWSHVTGSDMKISSINDAQFIIVLVVQPQQMPTLHLKGSYVKVDKSFSTNKDK